MPAESPSIFSKIVAREVPADVVFENDRIIAFNDIAPKAPVHILIVPKTERFANVVELAVGDPELMAEMVAVAGELATEYCDGEFRLVFNTGSSSGQTVFHVHAHVLVGRLTEGSLGTQ